MSNDPHAPIQLDHPAVSPEHKNRVRFGIKLSWPIQNAAIFVIYVNDSQWAELQGAWGIVTTIVTAVAPTLAPRLVCELSN